MDITEQLTHESRIANRESRIALAAAAEITRLRAEVEALRADAEMIRTEAWESIADERAHAAYLRGIEEGKRQATTPQDRSAPARREDMAAFAAELKADSAKAQAFFQSAGIIDERGELMPEYAAPQQAEPVAWRDHVEQRLHNWRQRTMNRSGDRLALDDMMSKESIDDLIDYVCDEWSDPVAPQQAEPVAQIGWSDEFGNLFPMAAWKPAQRTHRDSHKTAWRPVFLHPPAAEVQKLKDAARALCGALTASELTDRAYHALNALHRALEGGE